MVDPAKTTLGRMLLDEITPVVMVLRTPLVEEISQSNGISFIEMLTPFCAFNNIDVPVRTASDQPYRIHEFKLRLYCASDIRQPNVEAVKEHIKQVITRAGEEDFPDIPSDTQSFDAVLATSPSNILPSWFRFFSKELIRTVAFSEHESFDHPVACLLAVSSKDEEPINKFVDLFNVNQLPPLLNDGAMDPKILKHFVLVHDNRDGSSERATKILAEMRSTFGAANCRLLCINSSEDRSVQHAKNPWVASKADDSDCQHLGCFLNIDDMDELKSTMHDLSSKHVIPYMEQKIRLLNQQVSATRKGFRNQIKNLWWRKGKEDTPENSTGQVYTYNSTESQIRVLGDYAFMLRDYELALSNYRLLSTDYKLDKAWKRYAGVQEMMALTYFMSDHSRKDAEYCMENAFGTYLKLGTSGLRNATRCGLWWVEMLKAMGEYKEAANIYFRISGEDPLLSAVMLEQAAYCFLFSKPPLLRKYGFHLVLSGDLYKKSDQIKHAIRTYRKALYVFKGTTWNHIKDHVNFHIGKWYAFLGNFDVAMTHALEVLACGHQSKATQELFLRDFFQIVQNTGKTFEVLKLQLPVINISSIKVFFEDHRTYASEAALGFKESFWRSLEEDLVPSVSSLKPNWLESHGKKISRTELNVCVAGEVIKVDVEFTNPLQIPISISGISLICEHSATSDGSKPDSNSSNIDEKLIEPGSDQSIRCATSSFVCSEVDLLLHGGETIVAQLTVIPEVEGTLDIAGVRWKLSGSVAGVFKFGPDLFKKKVLGGKRQSKKNLSSYLKFVVIENLPKIEASMLHLPEAVYAGEMRLLALELRNPSKAPLKNLKIKISHSRFLNFCDREVLEMEFPACLERRENSARGQIPEKTNKRPEKFFSFPEDTIIHGGSAIQWPLFLRAATPGNISLCLTVYYEMGDISSAMRYRLLRMHLNVEVLPSLDVSFQFSPRPSKLQEFLLRMDIVNRTSSQGFRIQQLSSVGNEWEMSLLQPLESIFPSQLLMAGQALTCFFYLKKCGMPVTAEGNISNSLPSGEADVRLSSDKDEPLLDISRPPIVNFHQYERVHQGKLGQGHESEVDFVLIYRIPGDDKAGSNILSHHSCHCSVASSGPIRWLLEGPGTVWHNFADGFCEIKLNMTIHNTSDSSASVHIKTLDTPVSSSSGTSVSSAKEAGWHELSSPSDTKVTSDVLENQDSSSHGCVLPFIWCGSSSTRVEVEPSSAVEIPLQICFFSPGTYDISNYSLDWKLHSSVDQDEFRAEVRPLSGTCEGYTYYMTVLQQD